MDSWQWRRLLWTIWRFYCVMIAKIQEWWQSCNRGSIFLELSTMMTVWCLASQVHWYAVSIILMMICTFMFMYITSVITPTLLLQYVWQGNSDLLSMTSMCHDFIMYLVQVMDSPLDCFWNSWHRYWRSYSLSRS